MFIFDTKRPLRMGDKSEATYQLQLLLLKHGFTSASSTEESFADGDFGTKTENAVKRLQTKSGLNPDGVVGPKTFDALLKLEGGDKLQVEEVEIKKVAIKDMATGETVDLKQNVVNKIGLSLSAIKEAAKLLDVDVASIQAVAEVESRGNGFTDTGFVKILFERHKFYKFYKEKYGKTAADSLSAKYPDICNTKKGGYLGGRKEHYRLDAAIKIDRTIAMLSASWGRFQIMGFNYKACGFTDVESFVKAMWVNEDEHLKAFVNFVNSDANLRRTLKAKQWSQFAALYNGSEFKMNQYDTKLIQAYTKYAKLVK